MKRSDLRYLRVLYVDYDQKTRVGELVVNEAAAENFVSANLFCGRWFEGETENR